MASGGSLDLREGSQTAASPALPHTHTLSLSCPLLVWLSLYNALTIVFFIPPQLLLFNLAGRPAGSIATQFSLLQTPNLARNGLSRASWVVTASLWLNAEGKWRWVWYIYNEYIYINLYAWKPLTTHQFINHPDAFPKSRAKTHLEMSLNRESVPFLYSQNITQWNAFGSIKQI